MRKTCLPEMKETDYFIAEKNYARGEAWYQQLFGSPDSLCGDVSPNYSKRDVFPEVAARLHAANPDARLIYIVRDPVARAISHYGHSFRMGQDLPEPEALIGSDAGQHILAASRYAYQLEPWLDCFPSENFLLIDFDELTGRTDQVLALTCSFLGLAAPGPESMITASKNSAEDLAALPGWWLRLRETGLGDRLRAALPRPLTRTAKKNLHPRDLFCAPAGVSGSCPGATGRMSCGRCGAIPPDDRQGVRRMERLGDVRDLSFPQRLSYATQSFQPLVPARQGQYS